MIKLFYYSLFVLALVVSSCKPDQDKSTSAVPITKDSQTVITQKAAGNTDPSAISFLGESLFPIPEDETSVIKKDQDLITARNNYRADKSLENSVWYGRRMAYRGYFLPAIDLFTSSISEHPDSPELYRHRGHRYITTRQLNKAILDFEKAAELAKGRKLEIEPDGIPNKLNKPLSSLQFNIYYHLGLAHYLNGDYNNAEKAYAQCMKFSNNPDLLVATTDWYYLTLMRLNKKDQAKKLLARVKSNLTMVENDSYYARIKMYKEEIEPKELLNLDASESDKLNIVTQGYGVANQYLHDGDKNKFTEILEKIKATNYWTAFGYIAAEADLKRVREGSFNYK